MMPSDHAMYDSAVRAGFTAGAPGGRCGSTCSRIAAYSSAGSVPLVSMAADVDPADVPTTRSTVVRSTPAPASPATRPICQALPAAPAPARIRARVEEREEEVFTGV